MENGTLESGKCADMIVVEKESGVTMKHWSKDHKGCFAKCLESDCMVIVLWVDWEGKVNEGILCPADPKADSVKKSRS